MSSASTTDSLTSNGSSSITLVPQGITLASAYLGDGKIVKKGFVELVITASNGIFCGFVNQKHFSKFLDKENPCRIPWQKIPRPIIAPAPVAFTQPAPPKGMLIKQVLARQIYNSRGQPTLEVDVVTDKGTFIASIPTGESIGQHEAKALHDVDSKQHFGNGVLQAVANVNDKLGPALVSKSFRITEQSTIDKCKQIFIRVYLLDAMVSVIKICASLTGLRTNRTSGRTPSSASRWPSARPPLQQRDSISMSTLLSLRA